MGERVRMTAQSKVNIAAAVSASLEPVNGGYKVILEGKKGKKIAVMSGDDDPAIYPSMAAAKKAVHRHNVALLNRVGLKPEI